MGEAALVSSMSGKQHKAAMKAARSTPPAPSVVKPTGTSVSVSSGCNQWTVCVCVRACVCTYVICIWMPISYSALGKPSGLGKFLEKFLNCAL